MQVYMNSLRFGFVNNNPSFRQEAAYPATTPPFLADWKLRTVYKKNAAENEEPIAWIRQAPSATTQVELTNGSRGLAALVKTPNLVYIALPGSQVILPDTSLTMNGGKPSGKVQEVQCPPLPKEPQKVTNQAILLCAGIGSRMEPLSGRDTGFPKPALPLIANQSIAENIIEHLGKHGITKVVAHTYYMNEQMKEVLRKINVPGVKVEIFDTGNALGNAAVMSQALRAGKLDKTKPTLIIAGDAVVNGDLTSFMNAHQQHQAEISLAVKKVADADVEGFGIVQTPSGIHSGEIEKFLEKPKLKDAGNNRLANTAIYMLSPSVYDHLMQIGDKVLSTPTKDGKPSIFDYGLNFFPAWMAKKPAVTTKGAHMWAEVLNGYWHDVGKPTEYMEVLHDIAEGRLGPDMQKRLLENNYDKGVMYWPDTKEKAQADRAVLRGSVVVANRPDTAQVGAKLNVAA